MDKDTVEMTCERIEDELSGYLDNVLDPQLRRKVEAHLATCDHCQEVLADFRRGDEMLRALPFIEPPADMRDRFFSSPRYLKLANERAHQRNFTTPLTAALVAAAMLVLALGGAFLFRHGVFGAQQAHAPGTTTTIGHPGGSVVPLPAGSRLIYERDGALWSAPETGAGLPRQLTPAGTQVAGWAVSPNGRSVIYIDGRTGALHAIRSDAQGDTAIGTVTGGHAPAAGFWHTPAGFAIAGGIAWSPDNTRVAYVAQSGSGTALHVMNATGAADIAANPVNGGAVGHPLWSADSVYIAYTTTQSGTESVWIYNVTTALALPVAAHSDPADPAAVMARIAWQPDHSPAAITWATQDKGAITGIFRADATMSASAIRLTPAGATYSAADVSASGGWLLAHGATVSQIAIGQTTPLVVATLTGPVTQVQWSPSGTLAAIVANGKLALLAPGHAPVMVGSGLVGQSPVAWSPDGSKLAWQSGNAVVSIQVHQGVASSLKTLAQIAGAQALIWSPDGQSLAVRSSGGVALAAADGTHPHADDSRATSGGRFAWSVAG